MTLKKLFNIGLLLAIILSTATPALAQTRPRCDVNGDGVCNALDVLLVQADIRATAQVPRSTATPRTTSTPRPATTATTRPSATATATKQPTPTLAPQATSTMMPMPTVNPVSCLNCVDPAVLVRENPLPNPVPDIHGKTCPAWAHDQWLTTAPNGLVYRTWHPAVQPENYPGAGCVFDHEHGNRDPRESKASPEMPAYGYVADMHGMSEPHVGFKTHFENAGGCNDFESFCSTSDVKVTFHQGTLGAGRVNQRMHTLEFDLVNRNGAVIHVKGMGDTGFASNQCVPADQVDTENGTIGVRFFALPFAQAKACGLGTPYEVWEWALTVGENRVHAKLGAFDAITALNPQSGLLEPTSGTWPNAPFGGCKRDMYAGPIYINVDIDGVDAHGIKQVMKRGSVQNFPLDTVGKSAFKNSYNGCGKFDYTNN